MRPIKFRAWHASSHTMIEHKDLEVGLKNINNKSSLVYMQFTGLLDCNATEIYEGDIVDFETPDKSISHLTGRYFVSFDDASFWFSDGSRRYRLDGNFLTVQGDIHTTPELLEANHD